MKPTPQAIENAAREIAERHGFADWCSTDMYLDLAKAALSADLGDMVLVPKEATDAMLIAALRVTRNEPYGPADDCIGGAVYHAMLAAAEESK